MKYGKIAAAVLLGGLLFVGGIGALRAQQRVSAGAWLVSDVWEMPAPAFKTEKNIRGEAFDTPRILALPGVDMQKMAESRPADGAALRQGKGGLYWHALPVDTAAQTADASAEADTSGRIAWRYYCTYLTVDRFVKAEYALRFAPVYELYIDGKKVLTQGKAQAAGDTAKPSQKTYSAAVEPGLHVLIVRALEEPGRPYALPELTVETESADAVLALSLQARERYDLPHYLFGERVGAPKLSH
ncbi:MAG: hypothetical protein K2O53_05685, partial [Bacteroidales bacterium]|nr:hypothetical protein [Bacteroidales bacterium]